MVMMDELNNAIVRLIHAQRGWVLNFIGAGRGQAVISSKCVNRKAGEALAGTYCILIIE